MALREGIASKGLRLFAASALFAVAVGFAPAPAAAESISVAPTRLTVAGGGQQSMLTVTADGARQSVVQVRVFKWKENRPAHELRPTKDVVVSPPISRLSPRQELTVRVVRTKRKPVRGRECYRVLVDRLPNRLEADQMVALRIRHSVPLCFTG